MFFKIDDPEKNYLLVAEKFNKRVLKNLSKEYKNYFETIECCISFEGRSKNTFSNAKSFR